MEERSSVAKANLSNEDSPFSAQSRPRVASQNLEITDLALI